jgi:hypothetical protein
MANVIVNATDNGEAATTDATSTVRCIVWTNRKYVLSMHEDFFCRIFAKKRELLGWVFIAIKDGRSWVVDSWYEASRYVFVWGGSN